MMQAVIKTLDGMHVHDILSRKDELASARQEYKFIIPIEKLGDVLKMLKEDFYYSYFDEDFIYKYKSTYFDTDDYKFFKIQRQGKYNRMKLRVREYKNGVISSFLESKKKVKGSYIKKTREKISSQHEYEKDILDKHDFISEDLAKYNLDTKDMKNNTEVYYNRINLIAKDFKTRITIDFDIYARDKNSGFKSLIPNFCILEVKSREFPKKIVRFLKRNFKIREEGFSKYCVALCVLNKDLKQNKWKKIFKKYFKS